MPGGTRKDFSARLVALNKTRKAKHLIRVNVTNVHKHTNH
jgi:hypothetical protein